MTTFRHVGIVVKSISKSIKYYRQFGFRFVLQRTLFKAFLRKILGETYYSLSYAKMTLNNNEPPALELYQWKPYRGNTSLGYHFALTMDNLLEFYKTHKKKINFISAPARENKKSTLICFCKDPDGNVIELVQR